jgi:hypothetical protein
MATSLQAMQMQEEPEGLYPNANPKKYETKLSPADEVKFQSWLTQNAKEGKIPIDDYNYYKKNGYGRDYDMRAAFEKGIKPEINPNDKQWHWNDYGKKPNEETFSDQSKYHGVDGLMGGTWAEGDKFIAPILGNKNSTIINDNILSNISIRNKLLSQMKNKK